MTRPGPVDVAVGSTVRALRVERGVSRAVLEEAMGITFTMLYALEGGRAKWTAGYMVAAAAALGVAPGRLFDDVPAAQRGQSAQRRTPDELREYIAAHSIVDGDCRIWTGPTQSGPRKGTFGSLNAAAVGERLVHRVVWVLDHGALPKGAVVRHTCGNTLCVAPAHLQLAFRKVGRRRRAAPVDEEP